VDVKKSSAVEEIPKPANFSMYLLTLFEELFVRKMYLPPMLLMYSKKNSNAVKQIIVKIDRPVHIKQEQS